MKQEFKIKFVCPDCKCKHIEEAVFSDYTSSCLKDRVSISDKDKLAFEKVPSWREVLFIYGKVTSGGNVYEIKYCCMGCGKELITEAGEFDSEEEALFDWLQKHNMLEKISD